MDRETQKVLSDITSSLNGFNKVAGSLGKFLDSGNKGSGKSGDSRHSEREAELDKGAQKFSESMHKAADTMSAATGTAAKGLIGSFKLLNRSAEDATDQMIRWSKGLIGFGLVAEGLDALNMGMSRMVKVSHGMSEAGVNFSDGLFDLARKAWETGTSLEEYSRINKQNAEVATKMGSKNGGLAGLASQVRKGSEQFGMFGYSIEGLDDVVGKVADTWRLAGRSQELGSKGSVDAMIEVASQADGLAKVFGKSRTDILNTAAKAQKDEVYLSKLSFMSAEEREKAMKSFGGAIMGLSAVAGDSGDMLAKMLAQTKGFDGRAFNTDAAKDLFNKILPQGTSIMSNLFQNLEKNDGNEAGHTADALAQLRQQIDANRQSLEIQAEGQGENAARARRILKLYNDTENFDREKMIAAMKENKAQKAQADAASKFAKAWENVWMRFSTSALLTVLPMIEGPLKAVAEGFERFSNSKAFEDLSKHLSGLSGGFTNLIKNVFSDANMSRLTNWIQQAADAFAKTVSGLSEGDVVGWVKKAGDGLGVLWNAATGMAAFTVDTLLPAMKWMGEHINGVVKGLVIFGGALLALKAVSAIGSIIGGVRSLFNLASMTVNAAKVIINGSEMGGGLSDMFGGGKEGGKGNKPGGGRRGGRVAGLARGGVKGAAGLILGGAGILGTMGVLKGLFGEEAKVREEGINQLREQNTAQRETFTKDDELDDMQRALLGFKNRMGSASDEEKEKLRRDQGYRDSLRATPTGADNPASPTAPGAPAATPDATAASHGSNAVTAGLGAFTAMAGVGSMFQGTMGKVAEAAASRFGKAGAILGKSIPFLGEAAIAGHAASNEYQYRQGGMTADERGAAHSTDAIRGALTTSKIGIIAEVADALGVVLTGGSFINALGQATFSGLKMAGWAEGGGFKDAKDIIEAAKPKPGEAPESTQAKMVKLQELLDRERNANIQDTEEGKAHLKLLQDLKDILAAQTSQQREQSERNVRAQQATQQAIENRGS